MLLELKASLLKYKPKYAYTTQMFQKHRTTTKLTKNMYVLNTKKHKRLNALITKSLMSVLFDPTEQLS